MRFVVATDGSSQSEPAIEHAVEVAEAFGASLTAVHAVEPNVYADPGGDPIAGLADAEDRLVIEDLDDAERRGRRILEEAAEVAAQRGFEVETELLYGDAVDAVVEYAEANDTDGIFVGHRSRSGDRRDVAGSVARGLIDRAPAPVTVVR